MPTCLQPGERFRTSSTHEPLTHKGIPMRRFSCLYFCASLVAALAPAALSAQTITFQPPHETFINTPQGPLVSVYADGNYRGKSINHVIVRYSPTPTPGYAYVFLVADGTGNFPEYCPTCLSNLPVESAALTADINGDGEADLITFLPACISAPCLGDEDAYQGNVTFMVSNGNELFTNVGSVLLPVGLSGIQAVVGDFNKDGKPDVALIGYATGSTYVNAQLIVLLNQGDNTFTMHSYLLSSALSTGATVSNLVTGDFNGDGNPDLAVAFASGTTGDNAWLFTFAGDGEGNFDPAKRSYIFDSSFVANGHPLQAADLNGDKRTDLVINLNPKTGANEPRIATLLSTGTGFKWASSVVLTGNSASDIVVTDFNKDGKPDLAYISYQGSPTTGTAVGAVLPGNGTGAFGPPISLTPNTNPADTMPGGPNVILTAMPFHTGLLPSLIVSNNESGAFWELYNVTK